MNQTRRLTEGAVLLAVFSVLLTGVLYLPILWLVVALFLPLPFIIYTVRYGLKSSLIFSLAAFLISFIIGNIYTLPVAISSGALGLMIGYAVKEKKGRLFLYITSTLTVTITTLLQYVLSIILLDINVIERIFTETQATMIKAIEIMEQFGQGLPQGYTEETINQTFDLARTLFPVLLVLMSFVAMYINVLVCDPILRRLNIHLPKRIPFREWRLPRNIIWYYLVVTLLSLFMPIETGTFVYNAVINVSYLLQILFVIQGLSFIYFYAYNKGITKALPIIVTVFVFLMPILLLLVVIVGIMDIGFDLRQRVNQSKS
ncbi:YybS family protein [Bacillus carboniphilus]|uniref:YybS family protein n=1 Tax=Bacillus carboniphilus TaxID=86663 RepID=A0ABN0WEI1_9BACI